MIAVVGPVRDRRNEAAAAKVGALEFPDFSVEERTLFIDAMNSRKDTLEEAIPRADKNRRKWHENDRRRLLNLNEYV